MTTRLGLWLFLASVGWAYSFWIYRRRELRVPSRSFLAALRGTSLALVLLLLMDVRLPWGGGAGREWVLVDRSPSMTVDQGEPGAGPPMERARALTRPGAEALSFGDPVRSISASPDEEWLPAADSRLAPALTRALEAGASRVTVVSDLRVEDPVEVAAVLRSAPVPVTFRDLGGPVVNAGVAGLLMASTATSGGEIVGEAELFVEGSRTARLLVDVDGRSVWDTMVGVPGEARLRVPVRFTVPDAAGPVHVRARVVIDGDGFPGDDSASRVVDVDPGDGELVLVSWAPDWEPRFLLPVLEEVTGLRGQGYLKVGEDRFMTMKGPVRFVDAEDVAAALEESRLGVAHGFPSPPSEAFTRAVERAPRLVVLPTGSAGLGPGGEWYVSSDVPASPLAGEIAGVPLLGLPPLLDYLPPEGSGGTPVLMAQLSARGDPVPALVLSDTDGRRRVEGRAHGFWRWAFRSGTPRALYRRLWSGAAGWLLAGGGTAVREVGVAPLEQVVSPGAGMDWRAGPAAGGILEVRWASRDGAPPTTQLAAVSVDSLGRARLEAPEAEGAYRWEARVVAGPGEGTEASGLVVVERRELDLLPRRAVSLPEVSGGATDAAEADGGRPLRTHPLPYLLLLGVLFAEWAGRRRSGLR